MKQGSHITNLMGFKKVLTKISTWNYSNFLYITLGEEIISGRIFVETIFAIHDSQIKEIYLCDLIGTKNFAEFHFGN